MPDVGKTLEALAAVLLEGSLRHEGALPNIPKIHREIRPTGRLTGLGGVGGVETQQLREAFRTHRGCSLTAREPSLG